MEKFYKGIKECGFTEPDFTVITHWHYDHTFGMHAIKGSSIAHKNTNQFLQEQKDKAQNRNYINELKADDIHFQKEYEGKDEVDIVLSDVQFKIHLTKRTHFSHKVNTIALYTKGIKEKIISSKGGLLL